MTLIVWCFTTGGVLLALSVCCKLAQIQGQKSDRVLTRISHLPQQEMVTRRPLEQTAYKSQSTDELDATRRKSAD